MTFYVISLLQGVKTGIERTGKEETRTGNSLLVLRQVIIHHDHNLLVGDAMLADNLVGVARVGLGDRQTEKWI